MTIRYLTINGVAERLGMSPHTAKTYAYNGTLPEPDALLGEGPRAQRGWLPETIDEWNKNRPGGAKTRFKL